MQVGIVGTGYVGLVSGVCFAEFGLSVVCVDKDARKIRALREGRVPFYEPGLGELLQRNLRQGRLGFSTKVADAVRGSQVVFIAVGTPPRGDGSADLSHVEAVAREVAQHIEDYKVVVTKSTVPVGTGKRLKALIRKHLRKEVPFDVASNPEFLREGSAIEDFMRPNRVVLGTESARATEILKALYRPLYLIETPFVITDIETAELIKLASNSFLALKISFINELSRLCEAVGADVHILARALGLDQRIGPKFLHPGPGFGGSCLPKDVQALRSMALQHGVRLRLPEAILQVNQAQRQWMLQKLKTTLQPLRGKQIAVLGLSFKPNTDDIREAPSLYIIQGLLKEGAQVRAYDPAAMANMKRLLPQVRYASGPYQALRGAHAVVILTEWNEFRNLDLQRVRRLLKGPFFFDLRNIYPPGQLRSLGFEYHSVGRP
jgi:UDPglucose 6-dehydrogenase